ncbi:MAG TPA: acyl-[acyl-carrier-protein] thioesterase [Candidatus Anaerostipes avistercoris]|uniref:Acyl-[acyl-carrier-protein] thioesterase n=1 Tax=Candidatus Anaerostipes avistercoris TaxID=2838462 RepID=A0A9D2T8X1_9FIRM|nr:acyl-[acyl-carrier-protein] thioesterase [Candidatus Anaerostipes avistercoris]
MYTMSGRIRYSETDMSGKLPVPGILDYFQDCSVFQSEELGLGVGYLAGKHRAWVLNSWQLEIVRLPEECEPVTIETWASGFDKFHGTRNFTMKDQAGEMAAYANSLWVYMDLETGRPVRPPEEEIVKYAPEPPLEMDYQPRKIRTPKEWEEREPVRVKRNWIDSNHHVNNSYYVKTAYNELPQDVSVRRLRVEYRRQAVEGDILYPKTAWENDRMMVALCDQKGRAYAVNEFLISDQTGKL